MADNPQPQRRPAAGGGAPDRRELLQAYESLVKSERERKATDHAPDAAARPSRLRMVLWLGLAAFCVYILIQRPAWLFRPGPPPETTEIQQASLKMAVYRVAMLIEAYERANNGRVPMTAAEAGASAPGMTYIGRQNGYTVTVRSGRDSVTYDSKTPLQDFLGDSYQLIRQRSGK